MVSEKFRHDRVCLELTIPVAKYHAMMVTGRAIIYLTREVKLKSRKRLPINPKISDAALSQ